MGKENKFYDGTELLSKRDAEHQLPSLYICCSRVRSAGKTWFFTKKLFSDFLEDPQNNKFILFCRNKLELGSVAEGMMKGMLNYYYPEYSIKETLQMKGSFSNIMVTKGTGEEAETMHAGYVLALSGSDLYKRISSLFVDACQGFFDEFMPENKTTFLSNEVQRFLSICASVSRGSGDAVRRFPVYFCSNCISVNNPYFLALNPPLNKRIRPDTKWVKGNGYVFQKVENQEIIDEHSMSGMNRAFRGEKSIQYEDNSWMNDSYTCVEKPSSDWGRELYYATVINGKHTWGVRYFPDVGLYYVGCTYDKTAGLCFNIKYDDMTPNIPILKGTLYMRTLRQAMENGIVRFQTITAKESFMDLFI
mgnify:CR=1 FL=1